MSGVSGGLHVYSVQRGFKAEYCAWKSLVASAIGYGADIFARLQNWERCSGGSPNVVISLLSRERGVN